MGRNSSFLRRGPPVTRTLYDAHILRLAADSARWPRLTAPKSYTVERRTPVCGSRVVIDVLMADDRVQAVGASLHACAFGQASASLLLAHAPGRTAAELAAVHAQLAAWLDGEGPQPDWPGVDALAPARGARARRPAILLPFAAAAEAAQLATRRAAA